MRRTRSRSGHRVPAEIRFLVEIDPATGRILHACEATYHEPDDVVAGRAARAGFVAAVDREIAALRARVEGRGRAFRTPRRPVSPEFHKFEGGRFVKKTRDDFGPAPALGEPDTRPDPATFPEPPLA